MNYNGLIKKLFWKHKCFPIYFTFFVTNRCNAKCNHCFYWSKINNKSSELSIEVIICFSKTMGSLFHVNLTGGEPFLRDDLHEIAYIFYKNCNVKSLGIPTNGYNPDRISETIRKIIKTCPNIKLQVGVSLDHLNDIHDNIRNFPGLFNNAIRTFKILKELDSKKLIVSVDITLTKENEKEIEQIYSFIRDVLQPDMIDPLLLRGNPRDITTKDIAFSSYKKLIFLWSQDMRAGKFRGYHGFTIGSLLSARDILSREIIINTVEGKGSYFRCLAGILGGVMYEDGEIFPCELLTESFGNIREHNYDFQKIWFSLKANKIRAKIREERCSCTHECFQNLNILFNIKALPLLLKEWVANHNFFKWVN